MEDRTYISRFYGVAEYGTFSCKYVLSSSRRPYRQGAKLFYAARLVNGRAVSFTGLSRVHSRYEPSITLCGVHTATPASQQCAGSPLRNRVSGEHLRAKPQSGATQPSDPVRDDNGPDRA